METWQARMYSEIAAVLQLNQSKRKTDSKWRYFLGEVSSKIYGTLYRQLACELRLTAMQAQWYNNIISWVSSQNIYVFL